MTQEVQVVLTLEVDTVLSKEDIKKEIEKYEQTENDKNTLKNIKDNIHNNLK